MPSPRFSIAAPAAKAAVGYCHGRIRNVSRGILAMEKKIRELKEENKLLGSDVVNEMKAEIQMLREVNARLRKGWCVKEE